MLGIRNAARARLMNAKRALRISRQSMLRGEQVDNRLARGQRQRNHMSNGHSRSWSGEEDEMLRQHVEQGATTDQIATKIGRSPSAVRARAYILRLKLGTRNRHPQTKMPLPQISRVQLGLKGKKP